MDASAQARGDSGDLGARRGQVRLGSAHRGVLDLMQRVLRPGGDLVAEFPTALGPGARGEVLWIGPDQRPEAALAVLPTDVHGARMPLRLGLVGSVCTDPEHRGRGLASALLEAAEERAAELGCDGLLLWADDPEFYRRRGFGEVGTELNLTFRAEQLETLPRVDARPVALRQAGELLDLYRQHGQRAERSRSEFESLLATPGMSALAAWNGSRCVAYALCGRGGDLQGVVHEWGGEALAVLGLVRAHGERLLQTRSWPSYQLAVLAPTGAREWCALAVEAGAQAHLGFLGMGKGIRTTGRHLLREALPTGELEGPQGFLWGLDSI